MSQPAIQIRTSFGDRGTIQTLSNILAARMKYMNETARDSIAALAINVLKSIRSVTKVAKKSGMKADVKKDNTLVVSCTTANGKRLPCARIAGSNTRYTGNETTIISKTCPIT